MTATMEDCLLPDVLTRLFAVLKSWADGMDAFRYEMFARRLVAAEHGRPDAVEWAQAWYNDLEAEERRAEEDRQREGERFQKQRDCARTEFKAGCCGNPQYQAFLDTVEHPEKITGNAQYMAWISGLMATFEGLRGIHDLSDDERQVIWQHLIQEKRDANLAPRLKKQPDRDVD